MKQYFVAYRFSGEDPGVLKERMSLVVNALGKAGIEAYCNLFDQHEYEADNLTARQIMDKAFKKIDESDGLFVLVASSDKSEGQLMEVGYTYGKKPIIAAVHNDATTYVDQMADIAVRWNDLSDLQNKLERLQL